jgi:hypothetical protein
MYKFRLPYAKCAGHHSYFDTLLNNNPEQATLPPTRTRFRSPKNKERISIDVSLRARNQMNCHFKAESFTTSHLERDSQRLTERREQWVRKANAEVNEKST